MIILNDSFTFPIFFHPIYTISLIRAFLCRLPIHTHTYTAHFYQQQFGPLCWIKLKYELICLSSEYIIKSRLFSISSSHSLTELSWLKLPVKLHPFFHSSPFFLPSLFAILPHSFPHLEFKWNEKWKYFIAHFLHTLCRLVNSRLGFVINFAMESISLLFSNFLRLLTSFAKVDEWGWHDNRKDSNECKWAAQLLVLMSDESLC